MRVSVLTVPFDPTTGRFDDTPLDAFSADKTIVGVGEQFFEHGGRPFWSLVVRWHPKPSRACHPSEPVAGPPGGRRGRADWRATLAAEQAGIFDALKRWRNARAKRDGKPPYVILTNRMAAEVARRAPGTRDALATIDGIGASRMRDFGDEILATVAEATRAARQDGPSPAEATDDA